MDLAKSSFNVIKGTHEDAAAYAISANIRRRHLSKAQQADLIVAALKAVGRQQAISPQPDGKICPGRPKTLRGRAIDAGAAAGISKSTIERAIDPPQKTPQLRIVRDEGLDDENLGEPAVKKTTVATPKAPPAPPPPDPAYASGRAWSQEFRSALADEVPDEEMRDRLGTLVYVTDQDWASFGLPANAERLAKLLDEKRPGLRAMESALGRLRKTLAGMLGPEQVEVSDEPW